MADETKPTLKDVLGAIVSGISHARRVSDMEVMRIADFYREHDYLEGLSIPRLRINQVVMELPVLFEGSVPGEPCRPETAEAIVKYIMDEHQKFKTNLDRLILQEKGRVKSEIYAILRIVRLMFFSEEGSILDDAFQNELITELREELPNVFASDYQTPDTYSHMPDVVIVDSVKKIVREFFLTRLPIFLTRTLRYELMKNEEIKRYLSMVEDSKGSTRGLIAHLFLEEQELGDAELKNSTVEELQQLLSALGLDTAGKKEQLIKRIQDHLTQEGYDDPKFEQMAEMLESVKLLKDKWDIWSSDDWSNVMREVMTTSVLKQLIEYLSHLASEKTIITPTKPADFYVRVDTESIKNAGTPQAVTRLRLVLREEGLEWMKEEGEEGKEASWKLLAE